MDADMETSQLFKSSQQSTTSPDGVHLATIESNRLFIRDISTLATVRTISLPQDRNGRYHSIRWSPISKSTGLTNRILVSDDDITRVWDLKDERWTATVRNGSGGMGKIVNADFGANEDEALLFSDFGAKVTVWALSSGRSVEIRDPKFTMKGYAFRPGTEFFALLSRPGPQDIVTLHAPSTYFVIKTISLNTVDAQGFKWSPNGRWIAIWDTPSVGYRLSIYSADGHPYRSYNGETSEGVEGLGVRSVEWSPRGDLLLVGGYDKRATALSTRTFSPSIFLDHTPVIHLSGGDVWQEQVSAASRTYVVASQPITPPAMVAPSSDPTPKSGVSVTAFNADGTLIASKEDSAPTTIWIWDLNTLSPRTVLIQHAPIKAVLWHPTLPHLLLIQCVQDEQVLYFWDATTSTPAVLPISFTKSQGRSDVNWVNTFPGKKPAIFVGDSQGCVITWPDGRDPILRFESPNGTDESNDSLYEILTGKKPAQAPAERTMVLDDDDDDTGTVDDTFIGKRLVGH